MKQIFMMYKYNKFTAICKYYKQIYYVSYFFQLVHLWMPDCVAWLEIKLHPEWNLNWTNCWPWLMWRWTVYFEIYFSELSVSELYTVFFLYKFSNWNYFWWVRTIPMIWILDISLAFLHKSMNFTIASQTLPIENIFRKGFWSFWIIVVLNCSVSIYRVFTNCYWSVWMDTVCFRIVCSLFFYTNFQIETTFDQWEWSLYCSVSVYRIFTNCYWSVWMNTVSVSELYAVFFLYKFFNWNYFWSVRMIPMIWILDISLAILHKSMIFASFASQWAYANHENLLGSCGIGHQCWIIVGVILYVSIYRIFPNDSYWSVWTEHYLLQNCM